MVADEVFTLHEMKLRVTISVGVVSRTGKELTGSSQLIQEADKRLYRAKHAGRNRVVDEA
jgi:diguanylate cyclase (GGDEF)-like protein